MKTRTYNLLSALFLILSVLSAFAFDNWQGRQWIALGLGLLCGGAAIALYALNRARQPQPATEDNAHAAADLTRFYAELVEVDRGWLVEMVAIEAELELLENRSRLSRQLYAEVRERRGQEGLDYETLEAFLWNKPPSHDPTSHSRPRTLAKDLCAAPS